MLLLVDRRRQSGATLTAAIIDDLAASCGRHAGSEAMRADTARVVGLVRALHR